MIALCGGTGGPRASGQRLACLRVLVMLTLWTLPEDASSTDPLTNVVPKQPLTEYLAKQGSLNGTLSVFRHQVVIRFIGTPFVPFNSSIQLVGIGGISLLLLPYGPAELVAFKEVPLDPWAPDAIPGQEYLPAVDVAITWHYMRDLNATSKDSEAWAPTGHRVWDAWSDLTSMAQGLYPEVPPPKVMFVNMGLEELTEGYILHPLVVLTCDLAVTLLDPAGPGVNVSQASAVATVVEAAVVGGVGTLVEMVGFSPDAKASQPAGGSLANLTQGEGLVTLEVTLYACKDDATVGSPECERQILAAVLQPVLGGTDAPRQLLAAGIQRVEVLSITERQPPASAYNSSSTTAPGIGPSGPADATASKAEVAPVNGSTTPLDASSQRAAWVPYHLDRMDQRSLPLDGRFTANATGTGVNVYIVSSGVRADHVEFGYLDGQPGTRVKPAWGYLGYKPLEDCPDSSLWFGYGTYVSSLCCGLRAGAAKNATIHSVRYVENCISDPLVFNAGGLPPALDLVFALPAVVLIDTWWATSRTIATNAQDIYDVVYKRLDRLHEAGVTIVAAAGPEAINGDPCDNVFGAHPAVISVAASDTHDQVTAFGPRNSSCISIWAPSAGLGGGLVGASAEGPSNYTRVIDRAFGAAAVVAGVAAQYLELHPHASPAEVKSALLALATPQLLAGVGPASPNLLLFTNLSRDESAGQGPGGSGSGEGSGGSSGGGGSGGGLGPGAIAGIVVGAVAGLLAGAAIFVVLQRRNRRLASHAPSEEESGKTAASGWEIPWEDIEILKRPDGSEWLLGEGRYGRVYKALKGGVQAVAVKRLNKVTQKQKAQFDQEAGMLRYVSRDANVTQFYGACVTNGDMMLVEELMEGGDLREALSHDVSGHWQWQQRGREVMLDIVRGVAFLHAHHVVHRDIKSKNVLLGRDGRAKVSDVGLAKLLGEEEQQQQQQRDCDKPPSKPQGGFVGTFTWAAPEVLLGEGGSEKADMYSLGVVLWEIVTEEMPQRGRLRDPDVPRECTQAVADAIQACMQRDPAQRPSARQLYQLLQACPGGQAHPGGAPPPSPFEGPGGMGSAPTAEGHSGGLHSGGTNGSLMSSRAMSWTLSNLSSLSVEGMMTLLPFEKLEFCTNPAGTLQSLGAGSFGTVYKALLDGVQPLAVKTVTLGDDLKVHEAFLREASILWQLRHPNIVGLSGVSIQGDKGYLLMELMEGGSLQARLNQEARDGSGERMFGWYRSGKQVALNIARGLHYLHSMNATHFDLKSGNVLLTLERTAKVADVGLSRVMSCTHHSLSCDTGGPPGTLAYMAPELMLGTKCTQSVDIFSLGVLLHEICSGIHPVRGHLVELRVPEDCPQELVDLCLACTALDPAARPSIRDVVERLTVIPDALPGHHAVHDRGSPDSQAGREGLAAHKRGSPDSQAGREGLAAHERGSPDSQARAIGRASGGGEHDQPPVRAGQDSKHAGPDLHAVHVVRSTPTPPRQVLQSPWEALRFLPFNAQPPGGS
ncbi:hypothetical protein N2152v2_010040 [Parachlorella kessleri]